MKAVGMTTLERQRQHLEQEVIDSKERIWRIKSSDFPDLRILNQLSDQVERNMQLINMIDQHLYQARQQKTFLT